MKASLSMNKNAAQWFRILRERDEILQLLKVIIMETIFIFH